MSNKWAESYGGHWDHSESQHYASIGLYDDYVDSFSGTDDDYGLEGTDIDEDTDGDFRKVLLLIVAIIVILVLM